jgi:hypothetical protein
MTSARPARSVFNRSERSPPFVSRDSAIDLYSLKFEIDLTRNLVELLSYKPIALARLLFQAFLVENANASSAVAYQAGRLELPCSLGNTPWCPTTEATFVRLLRDGSS